MCSAYATHAGCDLRKLPTGDSIGVSTVVARAAKTTASTPVGSLPKKNGPSPMTVNTARQSRTADSIISSRLGVLKTHRPKQTWASALHMSAFGGKADMG